MIIPDDILYEDNHIVAVNKRAGDLVQPDPQGGSALENGIKDLIKQRDHKPGNVFLGVVHRIDRPVSGAVLFAKTGKALVRLNRMIAERAVKKTYWAITERAPELAEGTLRHFLTRDGRQNITRVSDGPRPGAKEAVLHYKLIGAADRYFLVEVDLETGRHHQIRAQLARAGCPIRGDLKYGAARSLPGGGISLHSRSISLVHPVSGEPLTITAPVPAGDNLWKFFEESQR